MQNGQEGRSYYGLRMCCITADIALLFNILMKKNFLPISRNVFPTFQTCCPVGVQVDQTVVHFAHFQVQARKRGVLGGGVLGGV